MTARSASSLAEIALEAARAGAAIALAGHRTAKRIELKGESDLVTEYDRASEREIRRLLALRTPELAIVGEEAGGADAGGPTWWVDPIDGTTNFAHGHPFFCASVGLLDATGAPIAGAVVAPALGTTWVGARGHASTRDGAPCKVSDVPVLAESLLATGFPYDRRTSPDNNYAEFVELTNVTQGVRRCGAAALDLCLVADGTYDGYWERKLKAWDIAAGVCVVEGAGGVVTGWNGAPLDVRSGAVVATNGRLHDELVARLAAVAR